MMTTTAPSRREALESLLALNPVEIDDLQWEEVANTSGVWQKVLWRFGGFTQALVRYQPGSRTEGEPHLAAHHHIWVVTGAASVAGRRLTAGSYLHVPPAVRHPIDNVGPDGLTILQMHRPHAPAEAAHLADD